MARTKKSKVKDAEFLSAWLSPGTVQVRQSTSSEVQFYVFMLAFMALAIAMFTMFGSTLGAVASLLAAGLVSLRTTASRFETKLLYACLIVIASIPVGRILEMYGVGALNLILVVSAITFLFVKGDKK